jgi:pyrimidine-nucleoside phosphorylase
MSKKIAEGIGGLVLDVKTGTGAFMKTLEQSRELASTLVKIGNGAGVRTEAMITRMDAPLGRAVGNASEVIECIETLKGRGPADLEELSVLLAARMLVVSQVAPDLDAAMDKVQRALASGEGVEMFRKIIANQGGDPKVIDDYSRLPSAPDSQPIAAAQAGYVQDLEAERIGRAAVALGAGRSRMEDAVDHGVGIDVAAPVGSRVSAGDPVLILRHRAGRGLPAATALVSSAIQIGPQAPAIQPLVVETIA